MCILQSNITLKITQCLLNWIVCRIFCPLSVHWSWAWGTLQIQGFPSSDIKKHIKLQTHKPPHTHKDAHKRRNTHTQININTHTHTQAHLVENMKPCLCIHSVKLMVRLTSVSVLRALGGSPHLLCNAKQPQSGIAAAGPSDAWLNTRCER